MIRMIPEMTRRGIRALPSGHNDFPYNVIGHNTRNLQIFVEQLCFGLAETLVAATRHGGELMALDVGQVKQGMLTDLLLLDGNPLTDIIILQDKNKIPTVLKDREFCRLAA
jgi:imidazolonepropionase-like amidohydrolase